MFRPLHEKSSAPARDGGFSGLKWVKKPAADHAPPVALGRLRTYLRHRIAERRLQKPHIAGIAEKIDAQFAQPYRPFDILSQIAKRLVVAPAGFDNRLLCFNEALMIELPRNAQ